MFIKDKIAEIRKALPAEEIAKVENILKDVENEEKILNNNLSETQSDLHSANSESKGRKIELKKVKALLDDKDIEIDELKGKTDHSELTEENESLKEYKNKILKEQKTVFINSYERIKDHPNFEKAKARFIIPELKDEKLDWETVKSDDMEANINTFNDLNSLDYFKSDDNRTVDGDRFNRGSSEKLAEIKTEKDLSDAIASGFRDVTGG